MRKIFPVLFIVLACAFPAEGPKTFRISAVQESQVWIEGGLLDGLQRDLEGEVYYEIAIAGQKKRIVPARLRLYKVEDRQAIGILRDQSGVVNIGYNAAFTPKPAEDLLTAYSTRAAEVFASKDYGLSKAYYERILEALPGDPFALGKIRECDVELEKVAALARERKNATYYKQVIRTYLDSGDPASLAQAKTYIDKIVAVLPGDEEALQFEEELRARQSRPAVAEAKPTTPQPVKGPDVPSGPKDMVLIPDGSYLIGSSYERTPFANETPKHPVHLSAFYIDRYEVTNDDYKNFCDATGRGHPGYFKDKTYPPGAGRKPVVMISWIDADAYARWAGKRLPTELEWEAAAAGPKGRVWPWGDGWDAALANTREGGRQEPADVGSFLGDASQFGVLDMAGNVSEWTTDWYQPYPGNNKGEKEYGETYKVLRGGSVKTSSEFARSQFRARLPDGFRSMDLGFRCAKDVTK